ncbi:MAG: hypothetical protein WB853_15570, partial [Desulfobacterales bacterium]
MTAGHAKVHSEVDVRINEAEVCRSMGLYDESLTIYEQILAGLPESDGELVETVKAKIADIRSEIAAREQTEVKRVSAKDISMLKKTLSSQDAGQGGPSGQTLLDSAASFKELGLFSEAINEYEKLIVQGHTPENISADFADCLLKLHSPDKVIEYITKLVGDQRLTKEYRATVLYLFGQEMEKRDHKDPALDLYKSALK